MRIRIPACAAMVLACIIPTATSAQTGGRPVVSFGVLAGGSVPTGFARDEFRNGYQGGANAVFRTPLSWLGVRLDAGYQGFGMTPLDQVDSLGLAIGSIARNMGMLNGVASMVFRVPDLQSPIQPYATAGVGLFRLRTHLAGVNGFERSETDNSRGTDAGFGVEAPFRHLVAYAEGHYQRVSGLRFVPFSIGMRSR